MPPSRKKGKAKGGRKKKAAGGRPVNQNTNNVVVRVGGPGLGRGFFPMGGGSVAATTPIVINAMDVNRESAYANQMRDLQNEMRQLRLQMPQYSSSIDDEARSIASSINSVAGGGGGGGDDGSGGGGGGGGRIPRHHHEQQTAHFIGHGVHA